MNLPDVFYFQLDALYEDYDVFKATMCDDGDYLITWQSSAYGVEGNRYSKKMVADIVKEGIWHILDKKPLTAEQQKAVKEMKEQIAALDSSIKLNEQTIHHHEILIGNYNERKDVLLSKIAELEAQ